VTHPLLGEGDSIAFLLEKSESSFGWRTLTDNAIERGRQSNRGGHSVFGGTLPADGVARTYSGERRGRPHPDAMVKIITKMKSAFA